MPVTMNLAIALNRMLEGEVMFYTRGNRDVGGCWNEAVFMSGRPQLGLHKRSFKTALRKGYIERRTAPKDAHEIYRSDPERYQCYFITGAGIDALNAFCLAMPERGAA